MKKSPRKSCLSGNIVSIFREWDDTANYILLSLLQSWQNKGKAVKGLAEKDLRGEIIINVS